MTASSEQSAPGHKKPQAVADEVRIQEDGSRTGARPDPTSNLYSAVYVRIRVRKNSGQQSELVL